MAAVEIAPQALPSAGWSYELTGATTLESLPEMPGWSYEQEEVLSKYDDGLPERRGPMQTPYYLLVPCQVAGIACADGAQPKGGLRVGTALAHAETEQRPVLQAHAEGSASPRSSCDASPRSSREGGPTCFLRQWAVEASRGVQRWDPSGYRLVEKLQDAETNQGVVELMEALHCGGMRVAVKRMPTSWVRHGPAEFNSQHPGSKEQPWNDLGITKFLNGIGFPFACDLHGVFRDSLTTYVVSSFATEGDLFSWVDRSGCAGREHEARAKPIVIQVFYAVWWLHELGIAHRDLSLENILLTKDQDNHVVKIIDFGAATASRHCGEDESRGKRNYQAPEMHKGGYDAFAADNFALGVVLFATMAHDFPWTSTGPGACKHFGYAQRHGLRALFKARRARKQPSRRLIEVLSPTLVDAIDGLCEVDPDARLNLGEACCTDHGKDSFWGMPWAQEV